MAGFEVFVNIETSGDLANWLARQTARSGVILHTCFQSSLPTKLSFQGSDVTVDAGESIAAE